MPTERCVAIHKTWDNYTSMVTRECDAKKYNILCGTYGKYSVRLKPDPPVEQEGRNYFI